MTTGKCISLAITVLSSWSLGTAGEKAREVLQGTRPVQGFWAEAQSQCIFANIRSMRESIAFIVSLAQQRGVVFLYTLGKSVILPYHDGAFSGHPDFLCGLL